MLVVLSKDIRFKDFDDQWVLLKRGSEAYLDVENGVAYAQGYHFDILKHEFLVIN